MTDQTPERQAAFVHGEFVQVYAGEAVADVMSAFLARHIEEINADLAPLGVTLQELAQPAWMRAVWADDMRAALDRAAAVTSIQRGRRRG